MSARVLKGVVVQDVADKTISVSVTRRVKDPLYGKTVRKRRKYAVHDPENQFACGDTVLIRESKPHSKTKSWEVVERV